MLIIVIYLNISFISRHTAILRINDSSQTSGYCETNKSSTENEQNTRLDQLSVPNNETTVGPEVFLGGSCNPTTWRADVAIPKLNELGITFYNPVILYIDSFSI